MDLKRAVVCGLAWTVCSGAALAGEWNYGYRFDDDLPFANAQPRNQPGVSFSYSSDDPAPRFNFDNQKSYDATGNLSIDNDLQQDFERCQRIRNQMRSKDAAKLNC